MATGSGGKALVIILVGLIFVSALLPEVVSQIQGVNTTGWNFTGATGATTLWNLLPFIFIAGYIIKMLSELID